MKQRILLTSTIVLTIIGGICLNIFAQGNVYSKESANSQGPEVIDSFQIIDKDGVAKTVQYQDIPHENRNFYSRTLENSKDISYGVVYLNSSSYDGKAYLTYKNISNSGYDGYTTGAYAKDAAYLGTVNGKVKAKQSGVVMEFDKRDVKIVDYTEANISYYYISNGYIYHRFYYGTLGNSNAYRVGYKPSYMKENVNYYSYDGHYFYTDYKKMIDDYKNNTFNSSINPTNPHYNYFQYLSHRSTTSLNANQFNQMVDKQVGESSSKMKGLGESYINSQNTYGVNALLMFGVSANESAWGTSSIAKNKNNLFGHGAVDSNPYYGATGYLQPADSIKYHAEKFISEGYLDSEDWRYNGPHLGDKASGINVRYASDPYWGEKAASLYYYHDSSLDDYGKYTIGIIEGVLKDYALYQESSKNSKIIHTIGKGSSPRTYNHAVVILGSVKDSEEKEWYKILSDMSLNTSRTDTQYNNTYNRDRDYVYVPGERVKIVANGNSTPSYMKGDVNNNKKIDAADYLMIMDTILGKYKMSSLQHLAGDVNENGKIDAADYLMVMDCILGKIKL